MTGFAEIAAAGPVLVALGISVLAGTNRAARIWNSAFTNNDVGVRVGAGTGNALRRFGDNVLDGNNTADFIGPL
jgi:hypothetical protein